MIEAGSGFDVKDGSTQGLLKAISRLGKE